jgi:MFS family permease
VSRVKRTLAVIALLVALASLAGAVTGVLVLLVVGLVFAGGNASLAANWNALSASAGLGAAAGAVTGPLIAFIFLRRVPLWRATIETAGAAGVGAALGMAITPELLDRYTGVPYGWVYGGLLFAILAALRLRHAYRKRDTPVAPRVE